MGGLGSGKWRRFNAKHTVEQSLAFGVHDFRGRLFTAASGTFTWTWDHGGKSSVGYHIAAEDGRPIVTLRYMANGESVRTPIHLQPTPTQFGGQRWWFTCPLFADGKPCGRRASKLYLPPGAKYFGCRTCYDLTYRSCQEAHRQERFDDGMKRLQERLASLNRRHGFSNEATTCLSNTRD